MHKFIEHLALTALIAAAVVIAVNEWAELPTVYESHSQKTCVRVEDPSGQYSCENLPPKYNHVWVK